MKAYWINAVTREVLPVEYNSLKDMQRLIGGYIEAAYRWPTGDVLYVDEEGLIKERPEFFRIPQRPDQPLSGNGLVVGEAIGDTEKTADPVISLEWLRSQVTFRTDEQVRAWARANASEPAVTLYEPGQDPHTLATLGEVYGVAPPKKPRR